MFTFLVVEVLVVVVVVMLLLVLRVLCFLVLGGGSGSVGDVNDSSVVDGFIVIVFVDDVFV